MDVCVVLYKELRRSRKREVMERMEGMEAIEWKRVCVCVRGNKQTAEKR